VTYHIDFNEDFELCDSLIRRSKNIPVYATEEGHNWGERFADFITRDIPVYIDTHPEMPAAWFWSTTNLSGSFKVLATLGPPRALLAIVLQDNFFKCVLQPLSEVRAFATF
jgi:hypothetical protein